MARLGLYKNTIQQFVAGAPAEDQVLDNPGENILQHWPGVMEHHMSRSLCKLLAETAPVGQDGRDSDRPEHRPQGYL